MSVYSGHCFLYNNLVTSTDDMTASSQATGIVASFVKTRSTGGSAVMYAAGDFSGSVNRTITVVIDSIAAGNDIGNATFKLTVGRLNRAHLLLQNPQIGVNHAQHLFKPLFHAATHQPSDNETTQQQAGSGCHENEVVVVPESVHDSNPGSQVGESASVLFTRWRNINQRVYLPKKEINNEHITTEGTESTE